MRANGSAVNYRIGSLEKSGSNLTFFPLVNYRIGSLEMLARLLCLIISVNYRIGSLEIDGHSVV